jgi:outer membrane protein OmpA-like peptidoglycan-associated protein
LNLGSWSKSIARLTAVIVVAAGASACSSVPDWVDPTTWIGDSQSASDSDAQTTDNGDAQTPDLASIPDKPDAPSTADERKQVADTLAADRANSHYSSDALRAGTEPAAAPPPPPGAPDTTADAGADAQAPAASGSSGDQTGSDQSSSTDNSDQTNSTAQAVNASDSAGPGAPPTDQAATAPASPPPTKVATLERPPSLAQAAVPPAPASPPAFNSPPMGDQQLGFQPSKAPALDPSIAQFVAPPILARYEQTAAVAAVPGVGTGPSTAAQGTVRLKRSSHRAAVSSGGTDVAMGGPETMGGAVVANFDGLQPASTAAPAVYASPQGLPPSAVVFFPNDTTILSSKAKSEVRTAAQAFQSRGGQGFVRVVGHSSSRTGNMPLERHLQFIFERSQARATAVARELIRDGVPAAKVLVEAVGDSQPVYYESMPKGEDGNRRAEIFM